MPETVCLLIHLLRKTGEAAAASKVYFSFVITQKQWKIKKTKEHRPIKLEEEILKFILKKSKEENGILKMRLGQYKRGLKLLKFPLLEKKKRCY